MVRTQANKICSRAPVPYGAGILAHGRRESEGDIFTVCGALETDVCTGDIEPYFCSISPNLTVRSNAGACPKGFEFVLRQTILSLTKFIENNNNALDIK
jgi:hypothetical protein